MDDATLLSELRARLTYDPETGAFFRKDGFTGVRPGDPVGSPASGGRLQATFLGKRYQVAHLVWLWETGELPGGRLEHRNGDNGDSRFNNLAPSKAVRAVFATRFIAEARSKFGAAHDYSRTEYMGRDTKVTIGCADHGWFERAPADYLASAKGCPQCCTAHAREVSTIYRVGQRVGCLTVLQRDSVGGAKRALVCRCDCGHIRCRKEVRASGLKDRVSCLPFRAQRFCIWNGHVMTQAEVAFVRGWVSGQAATRGCPPATADQIASRRLNGPPIRTSPEDFEGLEAPPPAPENQGDPQCDT